MQLLKFGRIIDLDKLDSVTINKGAEELKEKLRYFETEYDKEVAAWDVSYLYNQLYQSALTT